MTIAPSNQSRVNDESIPPASMPHTTIAPDSLFVEFQTALAGRYSIVRELGRGGMGVVFLAREVHLDRLVAIKLLPPHLATRPGLRERFLREAQLAAKLSHPNIIPIHAVNEADGFVYFVMAYVDGETLAQRVASRGPLSAGDATRVLREVAWALGHAHSQGLVHRDVKPDNILLEATTERALVADFGIAAANGDHTGDAVCGTPEFMSPEQALGEEVDARSDLYSLGLTAFYALSGRLPFETRPGTDVLPRQVTERAIALSSVCVGVPRRLAQLVDWCLVKDPAHRPASANAFAEQLAVAVAQRREMPAALRAFVKRNGRMDGGGTILALLGAVTTSGVVAAMAGPLEGVALLVGALAVAPCAFTVLAARQLLDLGFAHADLVPAFRAEQESMREERSVRQGRLRRIAEWTLARVARVSAITAAAMVPVALLARSDEQRSAIGVLVVLGASVATVSTLAYLGVLQLRRDVDIEFWSRVWTGRIGTWAFSVARRWRGSKPLVQAMTHRATELSLSLAAEQLFESLPKPSRDALGDVPQTVQRLQHEAHQLRGRLRSLDEAFANGAGGNPGSEYDSLRVERNAIHDRLRLSVGALETIRLGLLRLHAGSISLEGLTTHLGLAAQVSVDVGRLLAAHDEVNTVLRYPRNLEPTPV